MHHASKKLKKQNLPSSVNNGSSIYIAFAFTCYLLIARYLLLLPINLMSRFSSQQKYFSATTVEPSEFSPKQLIAMNAARKGFQVKQTI